MAGSAAPQPPVPRPGTFSGQKVLDMKLPLDFSPFITSPSFQSKQGEPQRSPGTTVTAQRPLSLFPLFLVLFPGPIQQDQGCPVWEGASCHLRVRSHLNSGCGRVNPQTSQGGAKQGGVRSLGSHVHSASQVLTRVRRRPPTLACRHWHSLSRDGAKVVPHARISSPLASPPPSPASVSSLWWEGIRWAL